MCTASFGLENGQVVEVVRQTGKPARKVDIVACDFGVAIALLDMPGDMLKSEHGPIPPDARWITVHPHGAGSKGQPVLVVPADENGSMRVIGGAGGKLNMLKLRGVRSEGAYRQEAGERAAAKRKARKDQIVRDKELGVYDAKVEAHKKVQDARRNAQDKFVSEVASALDWDMSQLELDTSELTPEGGQKNVASVGTDRRDPPDSVHSGCRRATRWRLLSRALDTSKLTREGSKKGAVGIHSNL